MGVFRGYIVWWFSAENCHCNAYIWYKATLLGVIQPQSLWHYKPQHENVKIDPQECLAVRKFSTREWINLCIISETKSRGSVNISVAWNTSGLLLLVGAGCQYYLSFIYTHGLSIFSIMNGVCLGVVWVFSTLENTREQSGVFQGRQIQEQVGIYLGLKCPRQAFRTKRLCCENKWMILMRIKTLIWISSHWFGMLFGMYE